MSTLDPGAAHTGTNSLDDQVASNNPIGSARGAVRSHLNNPLVREVVKRPE